MSRHGVYTCHGVVVQESRVRNTTQSINPLVIRDNSAEDATAGHSSNEQRAGAGAVVSSPAGEGSWPPLLQSGGGAPAPPSKSATPPTYANGFKEGELVKIKLRVESLLAKAGLQDPEGEKRDAVLVQEKGVLNPFGSETTRVGTRSYADSWSKIRTQCLLRSKFHKTSFMEVMLEVLVGQV